MLRNHADLRHIQAILGHATITSTELYTHVSLEDLKEVVRRAHPHGRKDCEHQSEGACHFLHRGK
jgi:site-specific recombinase XerD